MGLMQEINQHIIDLQADLDEVNIKLNQALSREQRLRLRLFDTQQALEEALAKKEGV